MNPLALLLLIPLTLALLAWSRHIYPARAMLAWVFLPALFSFALVAGRQLLPLLLALDGAVLVVCLLDLLTLPRKTLFSASARCNAWPRSRHPIR